MLCRFVLTLLSFSFFSLVPLSEAFSNISLAYPVGPVEGGPGGAYILVQYDYQLGISVGQISGSENVEGAATSGVIVGLQKSGNSSIFSPVSNDVDAGSKSFIAYNNTLTNGSCAVGYDIGESIGLELYGVRSALALDVSQYDSEDRARTIELQRSGAFLDPTFPGFDPNLHAIQSVDGDINVPVSQSRKYSSSSVGLKFFNNGIDVLALLCGARLNFSVPKTNLFLFGNLGLGISRVSFINDVSYNFAYAGGAGVGFALSHEFRLFMGYNWFGTTVNFSAITPPRPIPAYSSYSAILGTGTKGVIRDIVASSTANLNFSYLVYGPEFGVVVYF